MIRLTTLGAVRVHRDGAALADLPAQKLRFALLVYLACERDVSRDDVVAMFWPDRDAARGKHALRQMLYELRHVLGEDWIEVQRDRIVCRAAIDAADFEGAAAAGDVANALAQYRGPFMAAFSVDVAAFEGWCERRRAHLGRLHRKLRREQIGALAAARRSDDAIAAARLWVEMDPLDDEAAHALIERLAAAGHRTEALQYYESYERQLRSELDVEPLDTTIALIAALRRGEVPAAPVPPASAGSDAASPVLHTAELRADADTLPRPGAAPGSRRAAGAETILRRVGRRHVVMAFLAVVALVSTALFALDSESVLPTRLPPRHIDLTVLPIEDATPDSSLRILAAELGDELSRSLGRSSVINVISPDGVKLLREDKGLSADSVGRILGADYVVSGRISRNGDQLRLVLSLIDGRSGRLVRDTTVARADSASRNLPPDVVDVAARFLRDEVGAQLDVSRGRAATSSERAWQHLLQGKRIMDGTSTMIRAEDYDLLVRSVADADSQFAMAARLDPRWADPFISRANAYYMLVIGGRHDPRNTVEVRRAYIETGLRHAEMALRRNSSSARAHEARGRLLEALASLETDSVSGDARRLEAERALMAAVELEPTLQAAWSRLAHLYGARSRWVEAKNAAAAGYQADPYSSSASTLIFQLFQYTFEIGEDDQAEGWCSMGWQQAPTLPPFAACTLTLHAWSDFVTPEPEFLRRVVAGVPFASIQFNPGVSEHWDAMIAVAYARAGQPDSARAILTRIAGTEDNLAIAAIATAFQRLGEEATAMAYVRRYQQHPGYKPGSLGKRIFRGFRHIPEFRELAAGS